MTYKEFMESNSPEAIREILKRINSVQFPDDLIFYYILGKLEKAQKAKEDALFKRANEG